MVFWLNVVRSVLVGASAIPWIMLCVQAGLISGREPGWTAVGIGLVANGMAFQIEGMVVFLSHAIVLKHMAKEGRELQL